MDLQFSHLPMSIVKRLKYIEFAVIILDRAFSKHLFGMSKISQHLLLCREVGLLNLLSHRKIYLLPSCILLRQSYILQVLKFTIGLRLTEEEERAGSDWVEHKIGLGPDSKIYGHSFVEHVEPSFLSTQRRTISRLSRPSLNSELSEITDTGDNADSVCRKTSSSCKVRKDKVTSIHIPCPVRKEEDKSGMSSFI